MRKNIFTAAIALLLICPVNPFFGYSQVLVSPDGVGNIWSVLGNRVQKLNSLGIPICEYSNRIFGEPSHIDASDPFRILVFYNLPQVAVVINSNAEELGMPFQLNVLSLGSIELICRSSQGGFWVLSTFKNSLYHIDNSFAPTGQQINLSKLKIDAPKTQIVEKNGTIYIGSKNNFIFRITLYGETLQAIKMPHTTPFAIYGNELWGTLNGTCFSYSLSPDAQKLYQFECDCKSLPFINQSDTVCFSNNKIIHCQKIPQ